MTNDDYGRLPSSGRVKTEIAKSAALEEAAPALRTAITAVRKGREGYEDRISRREIVLDGELLNVEMLLVQALDRLHENIAHRKEYLELVEYEIQQSDLAAQAAAEAKEKG